MAFDFKTEVAPGGRAYISPVRIFVNNDGEIVDEEHADFLLVGEGGQIPWETAVELGVASDKPQSKKELAAEAKAADAVDAAEVAEANAKPKHGK